MKNISYIKTIRENWEVIALISAIAVVFTLLVAVIQPFKYKATSTLLIIQNQAVTSDAYTATKSAEKIGKNLVAVIGSTNFYNEVISANPKLANEFSTDETKKRKEWKKDVLAEILPETGILKISAYNPNRLTAAELASTVTNVLIEKGGEYHGGGENVSIKIIDDVIAGKFPARPNLPVNLFFALIFGLAAGSAYVILEESRKLKQKNLQFQLFEDKLNDRSRESDESGLVNDFNGVDGLNLNQSDEPQNWQILDDQNDK